MRKQPPPIVVEVVYNPDPVSALAAHKAATKLLINWILEARGVPVTSLPDESKT